MELERFFAALKRRWWLVIAVGIVGAFIGQATESSRSDLFTATATIEIAPDRDVFGSETVLDRIAINEVLRIGSTGLRQLVVDEFAEQGATLDRDLDLAVQQRPDTELIEISVSSTDEQVAIDAANFWATSYLESGRERERSEAQQRLDDVSAELSAAETERLALDSSIRETLILREVGAVSTTLEIRLRQPLLWDAIVKLDQEIDLLVQQRQDARLGLATALDSSVLSRAAGPIEAARTGNGLGPIEGLLIGLSAAAAGVGLTGRDRISHRAVDEIADSVWPTSLRISKGRLISPWRRLSMQRNVAAVGTQVLTRLPETRLQVVSFAGVDRGRTQDLKAVLATDLESRGYSVSLMGDDATAAESRSVDGMLALLNSEDSVIFADHEDLQSRRFTGRIVTVVAIDEHRDREDLAANRIAESLEVSDSVLTVVAR